METSYDKLGLRYDPKKSSGSRRGVKSVMPEDDQNVSYSIWNALRPAVGEFQDMKRPVRVMGHVSSRREGFGNFRFQQRVISGRKTS